MIHPALIACALGLALGRPGSGDSNEALAAAEGSTGTERQGKATWKPVRAPLFGLGIETDGRGKFRLIQSAGPRELSRGERGACVKELFARLEKKHGRGRPNLALRTFGGKQLWADECVLGSWRIQTNVYTEHFRLLDPENVRRCWGSWQACRVALEKAVFDGECRPKNGKFVVLLHGLGRSRSAFTTMAPRLEADGWATLAINYPSSRRSLEAHAEQVARVLDRHEGVREVSFVTHSLGGLVTRRLLGKPRAFRRRVKLGRVLMLGPPNQGSKIAKGLGGLAAFGGIVGPVGQALQPQNARALPKPPCYFGVIAGGDGRAGWNPWLPGDDDGVVRVEATKLEGMKDFRLVRCLHTFMLRNDTVIDATRRFLRGGKLAAK